MAYQVIARKWRPQRFSDMVGQEHIAQTLRNAIMSGRIAQAYLFVGPRGIGKTTSARIFAKALNCKQPVEGEPCCKCDSCTAIATESSVDVIEIDAATHTQVEKAREICEEVLHLPIASKYKIYIIDEVHMLSKSAWNALLKTIEEPPEHAKFIFATTEVNKVLPTVISRCQRFDLKRIPANLIAERLALIARTEGVEISQSALDVIARAADGGMRDAQSLLDQMISFFGTAGGEKSSISEEQALSLFGLTAPAEMGALIQSVLRNDRAAVIAAIHHFADAGKNLEILFDEILVWLRGVMMCSLLPDPTAVLEESKDKIAVYVQLAKIVRPECVQRILEQLSSTGYLLREAINKQIFIETILLKAMRMAHAVQVDDLIARLNYIRKNGELAPLDAVPAYVNLPPPQIVFQGAPPQMPQVPPPAPVPAPAPAVADPPAPKPEAPPAPAPEPEKEKAPVIPVPIPVPVVMPIAETPVPPEPTVEKVIEPPSPEPKETLVSIEPPETPEESYPYEPRPEMPAEKVISIAEEVPRPEAVVAKVDTPSIELPDQEEEELASSMGDDDVTEDTSILLPKRKSVEQLKLEVKDVPIIRQVIADFGGHLADVHELADE